jgi:flagellar hook-basal body complex protein FliE
MAILPVTAQIPTIGPAAASSSAGTGAPGFADTLTRMVTSVEQSGGAANDAIGRMLDGSGDVHEAMIALQHADLTLQMAVQVRNKLVGAYQEIMRMPV